MSTSTRYHPCRSLQEAGIPCVVWFEDALRYHGVPTGIFSLYLLVDDINQAGAVLMQDGWTEVPEPEKSLMHFLLKHPEIRRRRLNPPAALSDEGVQSTVLLPAVDWIQDHPSQELVRAASNNQFYPLLSTLTNGLISKLLDASDDTPLQDYMSVYTLYLYDHVKTLKEPSFANEIVLENRQFHEHALAGFPVGTIPCLRLERQGRDELRRKLNDEMNNDKSTSEKRGEKTGS